MVIGCDVDGVLASFEAGFAPILTQISGIPFPDIGKPDWPNSWDWDLAAGCTPEQIKQAWFTVKASPTFWLDLPAHPGATAFLSWLCLRHQDAVYFITNRMGISPKWQTERWLKQHGYHGTPTVIVTADKGHACRVLHVDRYIDDKPENCEDVLVTSPATTVYMLERPYNRSGFHPSRFGDLDGFRKLIEEAR